MQPINNNKVPLIPFLSLPLRRCLATLTNSPVDGLPLQREEVARDAAVAAADARLSQAGSARCAEEAEAAPQAAARRVAAVAGLLSTLLGDTIAPHWP